MVKVADKPKKTNLASDDTLVMVDINGLEVKQIKWSDLIKLIKNIEISPIKSATYSKFTKNITLTREDGTTLEIWGDDVGIDIINSLTSDSTINGLSAKQGKILKGLIDEVGNTKVTK